MFRFLTYILITLFLLTIVSSVVSDPAWFSELMQSESRPQAGTAPGKDVPLSGELKKDPVCGTYTAAASSIQQTIRGQTVYFSSPQCRDKYVASSLRHPTSRSY